VVAAPGYPASPTKGAGITLPAEQPPNTLLFHAGTRLDDAGVLRTSGGRVLSATGLGRDVTEAAEVSRSLAQQIQFEEQIQFEGRQYRRDIAWREVARAGAA
jgi:phosphoribosylamine--glycine ligase